MNSAEQIRTTLRKPTRLLTLASASLTVCLTLAGCGGGSSSGNSGPTPNYNALFKPFLGTYTGTYDFSPNPTGAAPEAFDLTLALGTGNLYGKTVPVVTATTSLANLQYLPNGTTIESEWNDGKAYLKDAALNADGTISQLNFAYVVPGQSKPLDLHLQLAAPGTNGFSSGTFSIGPSTEAGSNSTVIAQYPVTLSEQSDSFSPGSTPVVKKVD